MKYCKIYYFGEWIYLKKVGKIWYGKVNFTCTEIEVTIEFSKRRYPHFSTYKDEYITRTEYENGLLKSL